VVFIIICLACFLFTDDNPELNRLSEEIRDMFDEKIENPILDEIESSDNFDSRASEEQYRKETNYDNINIDNSDLNEFHTNIEQDQSGSEVGLAESPLLINWLLILFLIPLSALIIWLLILVYKKILRTIKFSSNDYPKAIHSMFMYIMKLYKRRGLIPENISYSNYIDQIEKITPDCVSVYREIVGLWEESIYSNHNITVEHRDRMKELLNHTIKLI